MTKSTVGLRELPVTKLKFKYVISYMLITWLCVAGAEASNYNPTQPVVGAVGADSGIEDQAKLDISIITGRNLFASKEEAAESQTEIIQVNKVEATSLAVALMGTVTGAEGEHRAFIYDKRKRKQGMYKEGDFLQGALISQISHGKVIITVNGRNELLDIAEARKVNVPLTKKPVPITTAQRVTVPPVGDNSGVGVPGSLDLPQTQTAVSLSNPNAARARQIRAYRSRALPAKTDATAQ